MPPACRPPTYPYFDKQTNGVAFDAMLDGLARSA